MRDLLDLTEKAFIGPRETHPLEKVYDILRASPIFSFLHVSTPIRTGASIPHELRAILDMRRAKRALQPKIVDEETYLLLHLAKEYYGSFKPYLLTSHGLYTVSMTGDRWVKTSENMNLDEEKLPLIDEDLRNASFASNIHDKLFLNRTLPENTMVGVRLNLNGRVIKEGRSYGIQTIHSKSAAGKALGYDLAATVTEAQFVVHQERRAAIVEGLTNKNPMAAVVGKLRQSKPSLQGVEIRFNPLTSHLFVRADNGRPVRFAEEATIFNNRVFARGLITYWEEHEAPKPLHNFDSDANYSGGF